jgi:hypothetical protein
MLSKLSILLTVVFLTACQTIPTQPPTVEVQTVKVEVPIPVACKTPVPPPPEFCFSALKVGDDIYVKTRCLLSDRKKHIAYEIKLLASLNSCK